MTVVLHASDPHFGTERPEVLQALTVLARQECPNLLLLSGDITQRAHPAQFRAARAMVDQLALPVLAVPGNHDIALLDLAERMRQPYARYRMAFGVELEPELDWPDLLVVCVNTTRWYRHKNGEVSTAQVERVAARLQTATPRQLRMVVLHQPIAVPVASETKNRLRGHARAQRCWAEAGADLVLGGHIHLPYVLPLPGLPRPMWAVQAGTAVSSRVRDGVPNSVNLLRWRDADVPAEHCRIEQWDYASAAQAFCRVSMVEVRPGRLLAPPAISSRG